MFLTYQQFIIWRKILLLFDKNIPSLLLSGWLCRVDRGASKNIEHSWQMRWHHVSVYEKWRGPFSHLFICQHVGEFFISLLRKKRFMLDEKFQWNALKFDILYIYEKPKLLFLFFILCYFIFFPNECPGLCRHRPGHS